MTSHKESGANAKMHTVSHYHPHAITKFRSITKFRLVFEPSSRMLHVQVVYCNCTIVLSYLYVSPFSIQHQHRQDWMVLTPEAIHIIR